MGAREFLRWAQPHEEQVVLDGLARLHAKRASGFEGAKFVGYFRSAGLVVPVWELAQGIGGRGHREAAGRLRAARSRPRSPTPTPLDANERRARAGLVARQVTLR